MAKTTSNLEIELAQAWAFNCALHPQGPFHLVAIAEGKGPAARTFEANEELAFRDWVATQNNAGANIYTHVNELIPGFKGRKAKRKDVAAAVAFHVDVDDPTSAGLDRIKAFEPQPSIVSFSGGGYQAFWLLGDPVGDLDGVEAINEALANQLGGDACHNIDRIMRVPGTINWPNGKKRKAGREPTLAFVLEDLSDWSLHYEEIDFERVIATSAKQLPVRANIPAQIDPMSLEALSLPTDDDWAMLIRTGDDKDKPMGSMGARFPSRSEARFAVACELARRGKTEVEIAGIFLNSAYGISASILEKPNSVAVAYRDAERAVLKMSEDWPETYKSGVPIKGVVNALWALGRLGLTFSSDTFHNRKKINGHSLQSFVGDLTDDGAAYIRKMIINLFGADLGKGNILDAIQILCIEASHHPIKDYLRALEWDRVPRLETWLINYMGAEDTPLNRAIGRLMLVAAVRRIREPGCKFDTMVVLEGSQGTGKSTALSILSGEENFSDQSLFGQSPQQQAEALEGVWIYEVAELSGMRHADVTQVKAFITRTVDQLRPAYGRFKERWYRQCILVGTTNDDEYLKDETGNRRFLPVKTNVIDLENLRTDRDQLWAEAAELEADDFPVTLPKDLWDAAGEAQGARMPTDPWDDQLAEVKGDIVDGVERISTKALFGLLEMAPAQQRDYHSKRLGSVMRRLGWEGPKTVRYNGASVRGYSRPVKGAGDE